MLNVIQLLLNLAVIFLNVDEFFAEFCVGICRNSPNLLMNQVVSQHSEVENTKMNNFKLENDMIQTRRINEKRIQQYSTRLENAHTWPSWEAT